MSFNRKVAKKDLRYLPTLLGMMLLIGAVYTLQREFRHLQMRDIEAALSAIPLHALVYAFIWTVISYFVLTFYDRLGTVYAGHKISYGRVAFASFCAYALSHNLGLAAVSGAAVRYRLYAHWGLTALEIGKTVAFCSLTFGLGGMVLGGAILFFEPQAVPFFGARLPHFTFYALGMLLWCIVTAYVSVAGVLGRIRFGGHKIELPGWKMAVVQVLLATIDVAATATIFYTLLPPTKGLTWLVFLGIYLSSYSAGLLASLPAGIGVFDTAILFGLVPFLDIPRILGAIVVFRLYYYVIPLFLAATMFACNELLVRGGGLVRRFQWLPSIQAFERCNQPDLAVAAITGTVGACGILLLCVGVWTPQTDLSWMDPDLASVANQASQFILSLIGAGLVLMAVALFHRVNLAWSLTVLLLIAGAAFGTTQRSWIWLVGVLALAAMLVAPFRVYFYRDARLLTGPLDASSTISSVILVVCLTFLTAIPPHTHGLSNNAFWAIIISRNLPDTLRISVGITVMFGLVASWLLLRPGRVCYLPWNPVTKQRLETFKPGICPTDVDGLVMGELERAAIPFRRCGPFLLGLGDPAGDEIDRISAVWRLRDLAQQEGREAAVWKAGPELLQIYSDLGLTALRLGTNGMPQTDTADTFPSNPQYLVCKVEENLHKLIPILPALGSRL